MKKLNLGKIREGLARQEGEHPSELPCTKKSVQPIGRAQHQYEYARSRLLPAVAPSPTRDTVTRRIS